MIHNHHSRRPLLPLAVLGAIGIATVSFGGAVLAQPDKVTYNIGDQVEVRWPGDDQWYKAKITNVKDGRYFIVYDADGNNAWYDPERIRLVKAAEPPQNGGQNPNVQNPNGQNPNVQNPNATAGTAGNPAAAGNMTPNTAVGNGNTGNGNTGNGTANTTGKTATVAAPRKRNADKNGTVLVNRPILQGPVKQTRVKNGARPNPELLKKIIRFRKGEKAAPIGQEGSVTIDISSLEIGAPRRWNHLEDRGDGRHDVTTVYPVRVTYTEKVWYYTRVEVYQNSTRIINFHVDKFGEWKNGSEEIVKSATVKSVPRP